VAGAVAAGLVAWLVASHAQKTYEADARLLVGPVSGDYQTLQAAGMIGRTYAELAASRPIAEVAARSAGVRLTPKQVEKRVSASSSDVTRIVDVRVRHSNPLIAARVANAIAAQLMQLRRRVHAQRRNIRDAVLRVVWLSHAGDLEIVDPAVVPRTPVSPRTGLLVLVAALGGALAAALCAVVRDALVGPSREAEPFEGFEVESFVRSSNGDDTARAVERWLDEARSEELS
jgi:capsular polysaccharide biosynthesis protein